MTQRMNYFLALLLLLFAPLLQSCNSNKEAQETGQEVSGTTADITISKQQFESGGMELGEPQIQLFQQIVNANGYITPSISGWAKVSAPISGRVKGINFSPGDQVKKGQLLFSVESNEIIMLQQTYAESFYQLKAIQKSYDRQKALAEERVSSEKDFLQAESEYHALRARVEGLKAQLEMISIDPRMVEEGNISAVASVYAPIKGFVAAYDLMLGQYIGAEEDVIELIDRDLLQLNIQVFERDLENMSVGQRVTFYDLNNLKQSYTAIITQLGRSIDPETKTIQCIARIEKGSRDFVNGLFVETNVITCEREALAIPAEAFIEEDGMYYVLALVSEDEGNMHFEKTMVSVGAVQQDMGEILDHGLKRKLLIKGGYNLLSQE